MVYQTVRERRCNLRRRIRTITTPDMHATCVRCSRRPSSNTQAKRGLRQLAHRTVREAVLGACQTNAIFAEVFTWLESTAAALSQTGAAPLSFPKIPSKRIRAITENRSMIRRDACHPPFAQDVRRQLVEVAAAARNREPFSSAPERLIGTIRRECLDHVLIFGEGTCTECWLRIRSITTRRAPIWDWPRTRRYDVPSNR